MEVSMRRPVKPSLDERLAEQARQIEERIKNLPPGKEREEMIRKARLTKTALHMNQWMSSPGLQAPK